MPSDQLLVPKDKTNWKICSENECQLSIKGVQQHGYQSLGDSLTKEEARRSAGTHLVYLASVDSRRQQQYIRQRRQIFL